MNGRISLFAVLGAVAFGAPACAAMSSGPEGDSLENAPNVDLDGITPAATSYSYAGFTANALTPVTYWQNTGQQPYPIYMSAYGRASFSGSGSQYMGACFLWQTPSPQTCNTTDGSDCDTLSGVGNSADVKYCLTPNAGGAKKCFYRGPTSEYCLGSPVTGGPIGPGTYNTPLNETYGPYLPPYTMYTYACILGCSSGQGALSNAKNW